MCEINICFDIFENISHRISYSYMNESKLHICIIYEYYNHNTKNIEIIYNLQGKFINTISFLENTLQNIHFHNPSQQLFCLYHNYIYVYNHDTNSIKCIKYRQEDIDYVYDICCNIDASLVFILCDNTTSNQCISIYSGDTFKFLGYYQDNIIDSIYLNKSMMISVFNFYDYIHNTRDVIYSYQQLKFIHVDDFDIHNYIGVPYDLSSITMLNYICIFPIYNNVIYIYRSSDFSLYKIIEMDINEYIINIYYANYSNYLYICTCIFQTLYIYKYEMNSFIKVNS